MRVYREEIFGPVMPVIDYGPEDDVVALANDTEYGLAALSLHTQPGTRDGGSPGHALWVGVRQ